MYGVSKINIEPSLMMISVQDVEFKGNSLARYLQIFADNGVVVDMISQSAPHGTTIDFSFTASSREISKSLVVISSTSMPAIAREFSARAATPQLVTISSPNRFSLE